MILADLSLKVQEKRTNQEHQTYFFLTDCKIPAYLEKLCIFHYNESQVPRMLTLQNGFQQKSNLYKLLDNSNNLEPNQKEKHHLKSKKNTVKILTDYIAKQHIWNNCTPTLLHG